VNEILELHPGPVMLFGGAYSNLAATRAIRMAADQLGLAPTNCVCTGDIVAYCAHPEETVDEMRDWGIPVVMGNCEESLATGADDCGCGFDAGSTCSVLSRGWYAFANRRVSADNRAWMRSLPRQLAFRLANLDFLVVHGSVSRINRFVFPSTAVEVKQAELDLAPADIVIGGHSGIPFGERIGAKAWLNAGAIGLPANDGTTGGWYLLLVPGSEGVTAHWHRLCYDPVDESIEMRRHGMETAYAETLLSGLWPSMDVLPAAERRQCGQRLAVPSLRIRAGS
jgi:predicted phosphodiesterase